MNFSFSAIKKCSLSTRNWTAKSVLFLLVWYSIATTLFTAILSPVFLNDCITFFDTIGKGIVSLLQEFVTGADSFGQLSNGISNSIVSGIVYWLFTAIVMGILFLITGFLIIGIGYQIGKIYWKYCWDIIRQLLFWNEIKILSIFTWGKTSFFTKTFSKVADMMKSYLRGNIFNQLICIFQ